MIKRRNLKRKEMTERTSENLLRLVSTPWSSGLSLLSQVPMWKKSQMKSKTQEMAMAATKNLNYILLIWSELYLTWRSMIKMDKLMKSVL